MKLCGTLCGTHRGTLWDRLSWWLEAKKDDGKRKKGPNSWGYLQCWVSGVSSKKKIDRDVKRSIFSMARRGGKVSTPAKYSLFRRVRACLSFSRASAISRNPWGYYHQQGSSCKKRGEAQKVGSKALRNTSSLLPQRRVCLHRGASSEPWPVKHRVDGD